MNGIFQSSVPRAVRPADKLGVGFLGPFVRGSWIVLIVASILQCIFFSRTANILAVGSVLLAWGILTRFFLRFDTLYSFPLSAFLIIGYTSTQFYFPLVFTLVEGKPIVYNLELPDQVFFHSIAALMVLVSAHFIYRLFPKVSDKKKIGFLQKTGFFTPPAELQLWIMGAVGLAATFYVYLYSSSGTHATGSALDKFIQGLIPFSYSPFFIPFGRLYGDNTPPSKRLTVLLVIYTLFLFLVSIGRNSRGAFMLGFTSVGFAYALGLFMDYYRTRIFTLKNVGIGLITVWLFTGPIADLGTAMMIVRQQRTQIPYAELIGLTIEAFNNKEAIRLERLSNSVQGGDWDEVYVDNVLIARFSNLKFNDTSLALAARLSPGDPDMFNFTVDNALVSFSQPVLELLGVDIDKSAFQVSYGDYLLAKVSANPWVLGAYLTGHFAGTGMAAFGWWYLLVLGIGIIPVYLLYDIFFMSGFISNVYLNNATVRQARFSFCGLLALTSIFQFSPAESVEAIANFLLRSWMQMLLLYFLMFHISRALSAVVTIVVPPRNQTRRH